MEHSRKKKMKFIFQSTQVGIPFQMKHFILKMKLKTKVVKKFQQYQDLWLNGWKKSRIFLNFQNGKSLFLNFIQKIPILFYLRAEKMKL